MDHICSGGAEGFVAYSGRISGEGVCCGVRRVSALKWLISLGTRPEVIKLAPVVAEAQRRSSQVDAVVCSTGQHREMLEQALRVLR